MGDLTTRTGTGAVIKGATYPNIQNITPPDALAFSKRYDNTTGALTNDYTVLFSASDDDGSTGSRTTYVRVNDVDPVINSFTANGNQANVSVTEGASVTFAVAAVSGAQDPTFDPLTTYDWDIDGNGNGSVANEYTVVSGCGTADTTCVVAFLDDDPDGSYDVEVTVNDEDSSTTSVTRTVTVNNNAVAVGAIPALLGILEAGSTSLTYSFTDAAGTLDGPYAVTVDWGDGQTGSTSSASHAAPGTYTIGPHTYADNSVLPRRRVHH
ncbi:MAG: hypothetical protein R3E66_07200 [bacterium]